jgi:transposase-like protein
MSKSNFSDDFKRDAVRQITERGYPVAEVSQRLGVSQRSLYEWKKTFAASNAKGNDEAEEIRRLKKEPVRVTEERDILKKRPRISPRMQSDSRAFIALHHLQFSVRTMCRLLRVHPSDFMSD